MEKVISSQPCPTCGRYNNRGTSIDAVIIQDGKVLLGRRGREPFKGYWALIGGYVEWDESTEEAVRREVGEETGLTVTEARLIRVYSDPGRHPKQVIDIAYLVETQGEPTPGDDIEALQWFSLTELPELAFDHRTIIADSQPPVA